MDDAYILSWDTSLVGDEGVTAQLVPFPGSSSLVGWTLTDPVEVPDRIYFEANVETVRGVDHPDNSGNWPIMSQRMRAILLRGAPRHRVIPVVMLDDTVPTEDRFRAGTPRRGVAIEGFAAVQLLERTDAMDMERSVYTPDEEVAGLVRGVQTLVFKDGTLPPLFRLSTYPWQLLVSSAARVELDRAGIAGVRYRSLDRFALR